MLNDVIKKNKVNELLRLYKKVKRTEFLDILKTKIKSKEIDSKILSEFLNLSQNNINELEEKYDQPTNDLEQFAGHFYSELSTIKNSLEELKKKEWSYEIDSEKLRGDPGEDYVLTDEDKEEIASMITVPIVEKIIEKTEIIKEQPIVTNEVKEVAVTDEPLVIADKLNTLEQKVERKVIKGLDDELKKIRHSINSSSQLFMRGGGDGLNVTSLASKLVQVDLSDQCDGINKSFLLPAYTAIILVTIGASFPGVYLPTTDYTTPDNTHILLGSSVSAPESGQSLIAIAILT